METPPSGMSPLYCIIYAEVNNGQDIHNASPLSSFFATEGYKFPSTGYPLPQSLKHCFGPSIRIGSFESCVKPFLLFQFVHLASPFVNLPLSMSNLMSASWATTGDLRSSSNGTTCLGSRAIAIVLYLIFHLAWYNGSHPTLGSSKSPFLRGIKWMWQINEN